MLVPLDGAIDSVLFIYDSGFVASIVTALEIFLNNILWVVLGVLFGMAIGIIPGMGGIVALSILIPFTIGLDQYQAFMVLTGAVGATTFAGSITGILVSTPGTVSNAATILDGYPLTQKGESERAIAASALSSAAGATVAVLIFVAAVPLIIELALLFGPAERFWLVVYALLVIPLVVGNKPLQGVVVSLIGALIGLIGRSPQTGEPRFDFGMLYLWDGVELLPPIIGLFALAELVRLASSNQARIVEGGSLTGASKKMDGIKDVFTHRWLWLRCTVIGFFVGVLPGVGGSGATFISYTHAVQSAKDKTGFGQGRIEGVISSEAANDAKDGGQLVPTLGLGIPGSGSMAVFLGALIAHGITPSPLLIRDNLELVLVIAFALVASNILTSVFGLLFTRPLTKLLDIPITRLLPLITILALTSTFVVRNSLNDVFVAVIFGIFGLVLMYLNVSRIPFVIAFILAGLLEQNFHLTTSLARGSNFEAFFGEPISLIIVATIVISIVLFQFDVVGYLRRMISRG